MRVSLSSASQSLDGFWGEPCIWASTLRHFSDSDCCVVLFAVRYSSNPLYKKCHFRHVAGADPNMIFIFQRIALVTTGKSKERWSRISNANMLTLREIISDGPFESDSRTLLRKPDFFFGDSIEEHEATLYDGNYKWFCQIAIEDSSSRTWRGCIL